MSNQFVFFATSTQTQHSVSFDAFLSTQTDNTKSILVELRGEERWATMRQQTRQERDDPSSEESTKTMGFFVVGFITRSWTQDHSKRILTNIFHLRKLWWDNDQIHLQHSTTFRSFTIVLQLPKQFGSSVRKTQAYVEMNKKVVIVLCRKIDSAPFHINPFSKTLSTRQVSQQPCNTSNTKRRSDFFTATTLASDGSCTFCPKTPHTFATVLQCLKQDPSHSIQIYFGLMMQNKPFPTSTKGHKTKLESDPDPKQNKPCKFVQSLRHSLFPRNFLCSSYFSLRRQIFVHILGASLFSRTPKY